MGSPTILSIAKSKGSASGIGARARPTRVMVVDDSIIIRTVLARIIGQQPDLKVVSKSSSAELALKELAKIDVDVILLDLEMPGMGGLGALPKILASAPKAQVLVVSSLTEDGAEHTLQALSMGAADTLAKPRAGEFGTDYNNRLVEKIRALGHSLTAGHDRPTSSGAPAIKAKPDHLAKGKPEVLAIGASTGGIHAMCAMLAELPRQFDLPILVTQHLPGSFMQVFAKQLELAASRCAVVAENGMIIEPRTVYVAPGDGHLTVQKSGSRLVIKIIYGKAPSGCMPSVDPMLESLAAATPGKAIGVILSGMGRDGAIGAEKLGRTGGTILAQDESSSAVWGMPRAVAEQGLAAAILPPAELAGAIMATAGAAAWK